MLKPDWIPTRLINERSRPQIAPIVPPPRWRPVWLAAVIALTALRVGWLRVTRRSSVLAEARLVRQMLERLGGLWVKVGQLLGMRRDLFSADFCDVLSALQDHATGFSFTYARAIIEEDLGRTIEDMYSAFEEAPFAAASIGQIHRATIRDSGVEVAVKVRRPTILETVNGDIAFVSMICATAIRLRLMPSLRWADFYRELERTLGEELDYRFEATAIRDMKRNLKDHGIYAPKVFLKLSSERVLVMEFISGALMSDVLRLGHTDPEVLNTWLAENNIKPPKIGRRLVMSLCRQLYEDNYFHGDLHPGNIVLLRDSRIALIDFGSVGWLEADFLTQYNEMQVALSRKQYAKAADLFLLLGPELPPIDLEKPKTELVTFMRGWALRARTKKIPFSQKSIGYAYGEMSSILTRYRIPATWAFLRVNRAQMTLDTSLRALYPAMDYFKLMRSYNAKAAMRRARASMNSRRLGLQVAELLSDMPGLIKGAVEESFYDLEWMRRRARTFQASATKAAFLGIMIAGAAAFIAASAVGSLVLLFLHQRGVALPISPELHLILDEVPAVPPEGWYLLGAFFGLGVIQVLRLRSRLRQPDIETSRGAR